MCIINYYQVQYFCHAHSLSCPCHNLFMLVEYSVFNNIQRINSLCSCVCCDFQRVSTVTRIAGDISLCITVVTVKS